MSIWVHEGVYDDPTESDVTCPNCIFCCSELHLIKIVSDNILRAEIRVCLMCGWWCRNERFRKCDEDYYFEAGSLRYFHSMRGACAQLRNLDLDDISIPLAEIRQYLVAKYSERFSLSPKRLEDLVADVFEDHGYLSQVTAYQGDGGIDVVLSDGGNTIGVQVKRYKNRIEAEQIRSLAGALFLEGHLAGVFVTTSEYRSGAISAAKKYSAKGLPIELVDAKRFYDALMIKENIELNKNNVEEKISEIMLDGFAKVIYENEGPY